MFSGIGKQQMLIDLTSFQGGSYIIQIADDVRIGKQMLVVH